MASEFPPSGGKPRSALELAFEEAKKKKGDAEITARIEAEEQKQIDEAIARMRGEGGVAPDLSSRPEVKPKSTSAVPATESPTPDAKTKKESPVSPVLEEIFGNAVPPKVVQMYEKLKSPKKQESYLAHLRAEKEKEDKIRLARKEEKDKKGAKTPAKPKQSAPVPEKPFDPHSVQSAVSVEEQKRNEKIRELLAKDGLIAPEAVRSTEVDISGVHVPQYTEPPASTQAEMDSLAGESAKSEEMSAVPGEWDWKAAKEAAVAESAQAEERELVPETAPTEVIGKSEVEAERKKLRGLVDRLVGKAKKGGEKITEGADWWKSSSEHLIRRSKELDAEAKKMGGLENAFRKLGEQYNKFGWKSKLAVGLGLGLGAGISMAAVSLPGIIAFTAGIGAQRAAGLATMYLKYEKAAIEKGKDKESKYWKERQMAKAMLYTAGMTAGMAYAVKEISETEFAQRAAEWLKEHWSSGAGAGGSAVSPEHSLSGEKIGAPQPPEPMPIPPVPAEASPTPGVMAETPTPEVASAEVVPPSIAPEVVSDMLAVEATPGKGYEYMAKRLWEQLQEKPLDIQALDSYPADSDIRRLAEATPESINKVVHELAIKNEFFKPDGASVRIDIGSTLSFNNDGTLALNGSEAPITTAETPPYPSAPPAGALAPEAPQMPDYRSEAAAIGAEVPVPAPPAETLPDSVPVQEIRGVPAEHLISEPMADIPAPSEPPAPVQSPESIPYILAPNEVPAPPPEAAPEVSGEPLASVTEPAAAEHAADSVINQHGVEVSVSKPHIYADANAERLFVYGGSPVERADAIAAYLTENPKGVVFAADDSGTYRIPWHLVDGKPEPGAPMRTSGIFGFFSTWMGPPEPGEFVKVVK